MTNRKPDRATLAMLENYNSAKSSTILKENQIKDAEDRRKNEVSAIAEASIIRSGYVQNYSDFLDGVKESFLEECIYKIFDESVDGTKKTDSLNRVKHAMCIGFIKENGVDTILRTFRKGSLLLSEMAYVVEKAYDKVVLSTESAKKDTHIIDGDIKLDFYDDLAKIDSSEVSDAIRSRVIDSINSFVCDNRSNKLEIEETLKTAKEKIDSTDKQSLKESYESNAKRHIYSIKRKKKNVLGEMVNIFSETAYKNKDIRDSYIAESGIGLDMDKVFETCEIMYTFLEMLNTAKLTKVSESYITNMLESLKA